MKRQGIKGSITVFLSLLLPLLLALVGTLLEAARFQSAKACLEETTVHAMQMMFSDYNKELWEDYHLFAFTEKEEEAESEMERAIYAALSPSEDLSKSWIHELDFWHMKLLELSIESKEMLTDEDGDILKHEMIEFMKYQVGESFVKELLGLFHVIKETKAAARVSEQKLKTEQELYHYSKEMLQFMELIDGIDFGKNGIQRHPISGKIKIKDSFVKQFLYGGADRAILGFEDGIVWESLKDNYYNPKESLKELQELIEDTKEAFAERKQCEEQLAKQEEELKKQIKAKRKTETQKQTETKNQIEIETEITEEEKIKVEIQALQDRIRKAEKVKREFAALWKRKTKKLKEKAVSVRICAEKAQKLIPKLKALQEQASVSLKQYQEVLEQEREGLPAEMYSSFSEDCEELAAVLGVKTEKQTKKLCDMDAFSRYLQDNSDILSGIETLLSIEIGNVDITWELLVQKESDIETIAQQAKSYHISELIFSYEMVESGKKQENPMETLQKLRNTTLLSLVVKDEKEISNNSITGLETVFPVQERGGFLEAVSDAVAEISVENTGMLSGIFGEFSSGVPEEITVLDSLKAVSQDSLQKLLLNGYVQKVCYHFASEKDNKKESVFRYEQEYILSGKETEKDNLASAVKKLVAVRTICNYLSLLSDSARQKEVYTAAIAIAGFTGLKPLVEVLKSAILLVWAYEEGMIDTAALLQGKKLPVIKQSSMLSLSFQELLTFGKSMVQKKAEGLSEDKKGFGYSEYLYLFFCMQKQKLILYRTADLVQFNMKKRYDEAFLLKEAVFGCRLRGSYFVPTVFFRLPSAGYAAGGQIKGWNMEIFSEQAY